MNRNEKVQCTSEYMWRTPYLDERAIHTDLGVWPPPREEHRIRMYKTLPATCV